MIIFLPKKEDSEFYSSNLFNKILDKINSQPSFCSIKEKNNQINLYLNQKVTTINLANQKKKSF